jgi:peptide/nickel transport system substrate-binding protein
MCTSRFGKILLMAVAMLLPLGVGPAYPASEPGTITIVLSTEPPMLDSGETSTSSMGKVIAKNIFETLVTFDVDTGQVSPCLATAWKQLDPTTWQFTLRKGVKFHDGGDLNAEAVLFSVKRLYEKSIGQSNRRKFFSSIKMEAKAVDSHTVEIKTDRFEPVMLILMSNLAICSPNTPLDKLTRNPIGTGPYRLAKWDAGTQIVLESFDRYWGKQPQVKKAVYVWRNDSSVRAAMVLINEADLVPDIARQDANRPDMDSSYLNAETTNLRIGGAWEPPLNDRRVRMALNYAIDRSAIRGSILSKDVIPATQVIVPSILGYNPDVKPWPYDPKKARQLLDEARKDGVPVDKEITLVGRAGFYPGSEELMEAALTMYRAVGLNVKLKMMEVLTYTPYRDKPYPPGLYLIANSQGNSTGDAGFSAYYMFHCKGSSSSTCDKQVDDLIEKAQVATGDQRKKLFGAAFKRIQEEVVPNVMLFHMVGYCRVGKRINFKPSLATNSEIPIAQITFK